MTNEWKKKEENAEKKEAAEKEETGEKKAGKLKKENFLVILLIGVLLLIIAVPSSGGKKTEKSDESGITDRGNAMLNTAEKNKKENSGEAKRTDGIKNAGGESVDDLQAYTKQLEEALSDILSSMDGAGRVKVMITLKASAEAVVEKDTSDSLNSSTEVDSAGGSRNTAQTSKAGETVFTDVQSGVSVPYVKQVICPRIEGVLVCAEGGGDGAVNKNITEAIQALFGIEVHKIKVIKMSSK